MITYRMDVPKNHQTPSVFLSKLSALVLNEGELEYLGLTVAGDVSSYQPQGYRRELTLNESARFLAENPTPEARLLAVENLFVNKVRLRLCTSVTQTIS